ncbi:MAG: hypothetical protein ACKUBY_03225 [Candidatus Moraniibacteriota bacterium]|jgi:hypothetical protein
MLSDKQIIELYNKITTITQRCGDEIYVISYIFDKHPQLKNCKGNALITRKSRILQTLLLGENLNGYMQTTEAVSDFWLPAITPSQKRKIKLLF